MGRTSSEVQHAHLVKVSSPYLELCPFMILVPFDCFFEVFKDALDWHGKTNNNLIDPAKLPRGRRQIPPSNIHVKDDGGFETNDAVLLRCIILRSVAASLQLGFAPCQASLTR